MTEKFVRSSFAIVVRSVHVRETDIVVRIVEVVFDAVVVCEQLVSCLHVMIAPFLVLRLV
jgi:hypothetical protein